MKKFLMMSLILVLALGMLAGVVSAYGEGRGTVRGAVYQDVNGDGQCVNTGIAGEEPVSGVSLEFVSGDGKHTIHLYTGDNGTYGLADAGFSNWKVTATPSSDWVVTSQNPLFAFIDENEPAAIDINFCVAKVGYVPIGPVYPIQPIYPGGQPVAPVVLPESGAPAPNHTGLLTAVVAFAGLSLVALGIGLEVRRRQI